MSNTAISPKSARGWRLLRLAALCMALFAVCVPVIGQTAREQKNQTGVVAITALPQEVTAALDRAAQVYNTALRGARWTGVSVLGNTNHPIYQIRGKNGRGNKIETEITSAGRIIEVEEIGIPLSEVPNIVIEALKTRLNPAELKRIEAIYQTDNDNPYCYGFEGEVTKGKEIEVYISADGKTFLN